MHKQDATPRVVKHPLSAEQARAMAARRWEGTIPEERTHLMRKAGRKGGRPAKERRCFCGKHTLWRACLRNLECCRAAGVAEWAGKVPEEHRRARGRPRRAAIPAKQQRCYCGKNTLWQAALRHLSCCRGAGIVVVHGNWYEAKRSARPAVAAVPLNLEDMTEAEREAAEDARFNR